MSTDVCAACGATNPESASRCRECGASGGGGEAVARGPSSVLGTLGVLLLLIGLFCLLVPDAFNSAAVANLQMLTIGETFTLVGAIFIAAQWRPRG